MVMTRKPLDGLLATRDIPPDGVPEIVPIVWIVAVPLLPIAWDKVLELNSTFSGGALVKRPKLKLVVGVDSALNGVPLEELEIPNPSLATEAVLSATEVPPRRLDDVWDVFRALVMDSAT